MRRVGGVPKGHVPRGTAREKEVQRASAVAHAASSERNERAMEGGARLVPPVRTNINLGGPRCCQVEENGVRPRVRRERPFGAAVRLSRGMARIAAYRRVQHIEVDLR